MKSFHDHVVDLFHAHFDHLHRYLVRLSGDPELADDVAQEAFAKLFQRTALPEHPEAWLITVATNAFRNARSKDSRRARLLSAVRGEDMLPAPSRSPVETAEAQSTSQRVRAAIDRLPERDKQLLLLRAEGYAYRDMAEALGINEASIGTLLARAKRAFLALYEETSDAS